MKSQKINIILIIIISIFSGLLAGFFGCLLFLISKTINIPFAGNLEKYLPKREITIKTQEKITVNRDVLIEESVNELKKEIVKIVFTKKKSEKVTDNIYLEKEILGSGFILTNDGWIISTEAVISNFQKDYSILTEDNKLYPVEKIIKDDFTGVVFLKISASDLAVVNLSDKEGITSGQEILIFDKNANLFISFLSKLKYCPLKEKTDLIRSAEKFCEFLLLDKELDDNFYGSALINLSKGFIGIVGKDNQIIPSYYFRNLINQVLKNGKIERPYLGIDYIDLSSVALGELGDVSQPNLANGKGVLVYQLAKDSPAIKAGLEKDDIILKINNDAVNHKISFQELMQDYKKGDILELSVLRLGKEMIIELKL
ncbi:MAG: protease do [Parcubacteria group bacterium Athens1014_10]|nr:MAG: protease do [Parcubacteria group bacterium Athens1014_10]